MNKKFKKNIKIGVGSFLLFNLALAIWLLSSKSTPSDKEFTDTIDDYDDKEFYHLTHNDDGTINDYGKELM